MAIRAVVFDIGGVLEFTPYSAMVEMSESWNVRLNLGPGELDDRMAHLWDAGLVGECSEADVVKGLQELVGMSKEQSDEFMAEMWRVSVGTLNEPLAEYFRTLRPRYQTGIISNSFIGAREHEAALYHLDQMADPIIYSHEVGLIKPDPRIYELACERMGVQPHEMVLLDDSERCIMSAESVGIHGVLFTETKKAIADIEACIAANAGK